MQSTHSVPMTGPLIVVAHQAFDSIASLALVRALRRVRKDVRILACRALSEGSNFEGAALWVDPFGTLNSNSANQRAFEQGLEFVQDGGVLVVFTSGSVSGSEPGYRLMLGLGWQRSIAEFIQRSRALVIPASVAERTPTEPHEVLFGEGIGWDLLEDLDQRGVMIAYLRLTTASLARWNQKTGKSAGGLDPALLSSTKFWWSQLGHQVAHFEA